MYHDKMSEQQLMSVKTLTLAYIGDGVYEQFVRELIIKAHPGADVHRISRAGVAAVNCRAQRKILEAISGGLSEKEQQLVRRGRNSKPGTFPKNAEKEDYLEATGLETLIGCLYLSGADERLTEIFAMCEPIITELAESAFEKVIK